MFRKLCALKVTGTRFYVSGHGARKCSGGPNFLKKRNFKQTFCGQNEESISHVTKLLYSLCICQQQKIGS